VAPLTVVQVEIRGVDRDGNNTGHMVPGGVVIVVLPYPSPYLDSICAYARRLPKEVGGPSTSYKKNVNSLKMEFSDYWAAKAGRTFLSDRQGAPTDGSRLVHVGTNEYIPCNEDLILLCRMESASPSHINSVLRVF
jgi:hypothetical protein